ncbi:unnamed protein product, partial [Mesorhabditis spiculigera]
MTISAFRGEKRRRSEVPAAVLWVYQSAVLIFTGILTLMGRVLPEGDEVLVSCFAAASHGDQRRGQLDGRMATRDGGSTATGFLALAAVTARAHSISRQGTLEFPQYSPLQSEAHGLDTEIIDIRKSL